jgi:hypothetical protein
MPNSHLTRQGWGDPKAAPNDQFAANFISLIASELLTQPPIRLVA